ncbi:Nop4p [Sugiyamaella lignohabitans]|uniref:Nop4p n=1 Tax=Sugiyamaella lignohabitans TaxID=796027 RepID=A0A167FJ90_9ASCO|nr:Nop4p [Sugiyamaella lignohabitans]ANB15371.1 Nop4p [Sugiyamaella lignohabitans]
MSSPSKPTFDKSRSELFVRSLPQDATSEKLSDFFSNIAPVKHAVVVTDSTSGLSKGFGFVSFADPDDAQTALEQGRKSKFDGKSISIEFAKPRARGTDGPKETNTVVQKVEKRRPRLIVRNLPWSVRDTKILVKTFSKYGKVVDAFIPRQAGGKMSGFAFVTMRKKSHALKAIEDSKDLKIDNRPVAVDFAVEKEKWVSGQGEEVNDDSESESDEEEEEEEEEVSDNDQHNNEANNAEDNSEDDDDDDSEDDENNEDNDDAEGEVTTKFKQRPAPNSFTVFVRNIPYGATAESLKEHFEQFGPIRYALPVMDKVLNQPKGTAFVAFRDEDDCNNCVKSAPLGGSGSLLVADDADPRYVFEGRILSITKAVERETADKLATASANERKKLLGKEPPNKDRRNLFLLNEGRITPESKLGQTMPPSELEIRQKSFDLRKQQLTKNASLHLSLTRLAIRNLPRAMNERALKALSRKAVVEFATEVRKGLRQPLTQEEIKRSTKFQELFGRNGSKHGLVRQAKIITEHKESGGLGRSRGYGFVEFRDHRSALMGLRWMNAHLVSKDEILEGFIKGEDGGIEEKVDFSESTRRRLVVEFAIENAQVVRRRRETQERVRVAQEKRAKSSSGDQSESTVAEPEKKLGKRTRDEADPASENKNVQHLIGKKRKMKKMGKN